MSYPDLLNVLKQVILSWQIIAVTIVILIYWSIVTSITNSSKRPKVTRVSKRKNLKRPLAQPELDKNIDASDIGIDD
jgi:predicted permease